MGQVIRESVRIRIEDVRELRKKVYIGQIIEDSIYYDKLGDRLMVPKRKKLVVCGIYPYMIEVIDMGAPEKLPKKTMTYIDMLMEQVKMEGEKEDV